MKKDTTLLERYRKKLDLSLYAIAKETKIRQTCLAEYEARSMSATAKTLCSLYDFFTEKNITIDMLEFVRDFAKNSKK